MKHHQPTIILDNEDVRSEICAATSLTGLGSTPGLLNAVYPRDRPYDIDRAFSFAASYTKLRRH